MGQCNLCIRNSEEDIVESEIESVSVSCASVTVREMDEGWGSVICVSVAVRGRSSRCG